MNLTTQKTNSDDLLDPQAMAFEVEAEDDKDDELMVASEVKNLDATQLYLGEIGASPLLTVAAEVS